MNGCVAGTDATIVDDERRLWESMRREWLENGRIDSRELV